ncbi:kunitz-type protease inhibitor 2-like [Penaeus monodon]|uniref:kunitz-type protease inhibitor 2-like n=1 Tax=Penaeus monodon TaxID=6687 RepID=UPI0018A7AFA3|nr:kunitz-type protease inhibitor 2-like [Penaeus monodon]
MVPQGVVLFLLVAGVASQGAIPGVANRCFEPVLTGRCRAFIPSYYFDPLSGACDCFVYGGCGGNNNRFNTLEECMTTCSVRPELQTATPNCDRILNSARIPQQPVVEPREPRQQPTTALPTAPVSPTTPAPRPTAAPEQEESGDEGEESSGRRTVQSVVIGPSGLGTGTLTIGQPVRIPHLTRNQEE